MGIQPPDGFFALAFSHLLDLSGIVCQKCLHGCGRGLLVVMALFDISQDIAGSVIARYDDKSILSGGVEDEK